MLLKRLKSSEFCGCGALSPDLSVSIGWTCDDWPADGVGFYFLGG